MPGPGQRMPHVAGLGPGDEAITTPITFCATANAVCYAGARPVFADIVGVNEPTIDPNHVARLIGPDTRAVVVITAQWVVMSIF